MQFTPPGTFLFCHSSNYIIQQDGGNKLLHIDENQNILQEWTITEGQGYASFHMDTESHLLDSTCVQGIIVSDNKLFLFKDQKIENIDIGNEQVFYCVGIFDGQALLGTPTRSDFLLVDLTSRKFETKKIVLDKDLREKLTCFIPCENVQSCRKYAVRGLYYQQFFYLFEREKKEFEKFIINDTSMFCSVISNGFTSHKFIPYKEDKTIRSMVCGDRRLVEIIFDSNNQLSVIDHLPWQSDINYIGLSEKFGIILFCNSQILSYKPAPKNSPIESGKIQCILEKNSFYPREEIIGWSEKSNSILAFKGLDCSAIHIDDNAVKQIPYWTREEIDREFSFKTYQLGKEHTSITIQSKDVLKKHFPSFRGEYIHAIDQSEKLSKFHITRGINCKTKYPKLCSENYIEMTSVKEFSNYLGAPLYTGSDDYGFVYDIEDGCLKYGMWRERSKGTSFIGRKTDHAFGILEPKESNVESEEEPKVDLNEDWLCMMESNEIQVDSGKLKVIDFTTDREDESALIENVKNGVWTATQLNPRLPKQILLYNNEYAKDHPEIEKDWETPGNIFDSDFDLFNQEIRHGWHVSNIIGIDHGVGIIDGDKFEDASLFKNTKQESMDWYEVVNGILNESSDKQLILFPYGLFSMCGNGDGAYPCLYKIHQGEVVAVKVAFSNYKPPRVR